MGAESSTMQNSAANATSACSGCKNLGNRYTDTVKVDLENINPVPAAAASGDNKENSDPRPAQMLEKVAESKRLAEQEKALKQEEEAKQQRRAEEEQRREREQQLEAKRRKQAEEERLAALKAKEEEEEEARRIQEEQLARAAEEERLRKLEEDTARQRQEEEERKRKIQQEEEKARRLLKEQEEAAEESRRREEEEEAAKQEQLRSFLEKAGFNSATEKKVKKGMMKMSSSFSYPLHAAVEQKDAEAVQALLWAGADPSQANSKKQTPLQLAQAKNNKQGSHAKVMAALAA